MALAQQPHTLISILRQTPALPPEASVSRALDMLRFGCLDTLAVADSYGRLLGIVTMKELLPLLGADAWEHALTAPVERYMRIPRGIGRAGMTVVEIRSALSVSGETALAIVDEDDCYLGTVGLADLLAPFPVRPRPAMVGGMATPWGVYLTNGSIQAGVGNWALVASGALMGLLLVTSKALVGLGAWGMTRVFGGDAFAVWSGPEPSNLGAASLEWYFIYGLTTLVFLLLLRSIPLSQYHAAEHQAVHALEQGEPLRAEIVKRMPRVHPRCGTNIMAGAMIFFAVFLGLGSLNLNWLDVSSTAILGALTTLFTWRSFGAFLQQYFTTRSARDKHLLSGIRAAEDLETKFLLSTPSRSNLWRRLWCSGMFQTMLGVAAVFGLVFGASWLLGASNRFGVSFF